MLTDTTAADSAATTTEASATTIEATSTSTSPASRIPGEQGRPCFVVLDEFTEEGASKYRAGVWHFGIKPGRGEDAPPTLTQRWVCSPLHIDAVTHDPHEGNFGRLLRFQTTLGKWVTWAMPMEMLRGDCADLRGVLLGMGVQLDPFGRNLLGVYLQDKAPKRRIECALQTGWAGADFKAFVLPDSVIGPKAASVAYQSDTRAADEYNAEQGQIAERLHSFIERHGDSRFSDADSEDDQRAAVVRDRAGWWQDGHEGSVYWFTADGLREALKGFDFARALDVLQLVGLIPPPGADGKRARFKRIRGRGMKLYAVHPSANGMRHGERCWTGETPPQPQQTRPLRRVFTLWRWLLAQYESGLPPVGKS